MTIEEASESEIEDEVTAEVIVPAPIESGHGITREAKAEARAEAQVVAVAGLTAVVAAAAAAMIDMTDHKDKNMSGIVVHQVLGALLHLRCLLCLQVHMLSLHKCRWLRSQHPVR